MDWLIGWMDVMVGKMKQLSNLSNLNPRTKVTTWRMGSQWM